MGTSIGRELEHRFIAEKFESLSTLLEERLEYLKQKFPQLVRGIRGIGLSKGIILQPFGKCSVGCVTKKLANLLLQNGVFVRTPSNPNPETLFFKLPIVATVEELDRAFTIIENTFLEFLQQN